MIYCSLSTGDFYDGKSIGNDSIEERCLFYKLGFHNVEGMQLYAKALLRDIMAVDTADISCVTLPHTYSEEKNYVIPC